MSNCSIVVWFRSYRALVLALGLIAVGTGLRLLSYFEVLPFRVDELRVAANVFERSFMDLAKPLAYDQSAPIGFLWLEKLALGWFGMDELGLRLVSLVAGIGSLILLFSVGRRLLQSSGMLFSLLLMSLSWLLIHRSADLKQYALDEFVTLLILAAALPLLRLRNDRQLAILAVVGAASLLLSFPSLFVLASVGLTVIGVGLSTRQARLVRKVMVVGAVWVGVFALLYWFNWRHLLGRDEVVTWFTRDFMPIPPRSLSDFLWFYQAFFELFNMMALPVVGLLTLLLILGVRSYIPDDVPGLAVLVLPIVFATMASALHKYPFQGRVLTFAAPLVCLLLGAGLQHVSNTLSRQRGLTVAVITILVTAGLLHKFVSQPKWSGGRYDMVPVLSHVVQRALADDVILVSDALEFPYAYYAERQGISHAVHYVRLPEVVGAPIAPPEDVREVLETHRRAWVFVPHSHVVARGKSVDAREATLAAFDALGQRMDAFDSVNVAVFLYQLAPRTMHFSVNSPSK